MKFTDFILSQTTLDALATKGITEPTPIQEAAIPVLMNENGSVLGQARTGTGKTAAFGIPIIEKIETGAKYPQALILTPTRELCLQVADEIKSLCGAKKINIVTVYGGASIEMQLHSLKRGAAVVVGTPGRIQDMIERKALLLDEVSFAVLDEADEMLDMGFLEDIENILERVPAERRMLMFSATMPPEILEIAKRFMPDCKIIKVDTDLPDLKQTMQCAILVRKENKVSALLRIMNLHPDMYALVFCRTRSDVDDLCNELTRLNCHVEALHGEITQAQRTKVINQFKEHIFNILIATDVAARGIDVTGLTHVINFSIPQSAEIYIHRIGRTGRAGKTGTAITFVTPSERKKFNDIEREINTQVEFQPLPDPEEVALACREQLRITLSAIHPPEEYKMFASELLAYQTPEAVIAALLYNGFGDKFLPSAYPQIACPEKKRQTENPKVTKRKAPPEHKDSFVCLTFGKGRIDGMTPKALLELIYDTVQITSKRLGKVTCYPKYSCIEVPPSLSSKIVSGVNGHTHSILMRVDKELRNSEIKSIRHKSEKHDKDCFSQIVPEKIEKKTKKKKTGNF